MQQCRSGMIGTVSKKLQKKLDPHAPPRSLVENYLIEIAKEMLHIISHHMNDIFLWLYIMNIVIEARYRITMLTLSRIELLSYQMNYQLKSEWLILSI